MTGFRDKGGEPPHFLGHRERLKARFRDAGPDALPDYELLELILFQVLPRRDTKPIAKALLVRFGSFSEVLSAPEALLMEVGGVGESVCTTSSSCGPPRNASPATRSRIAPSSIHGVR